MAQGLQEFYNSIKEKNLSRTHLFRIVQIASDINISDDYLIFATAAAVPKLQIKTENISFRGFDYKIPTTKIYPEEYYNIMFYCDEKLALYQLFRDWQNSYFSEKTFSGKNYDLKSCLQLDILDDSLDIVKSFKLYGIIPFQLGELKYSFMEDSKIQTFELIVKYSWIDEYQRPIKKEDVGFFGKVGDILKGIGGTGRKVFEGVQDVKRVVDEIGNIKKLF